MDEASVAFLRVATALFFLTIFLDLLELSFGRILWFIQTLRFWLYFILHYGLSCLAAYLLHDAVSQWWLLSILATFLGVAVISNTNIKIAGLSLVPIADLFTSIKSRMFEQAGQDKANAIAKAILVERLHKLPLATVESGCRAALLANGHSAQKVQKIIDRARQKAKDDGAYLKSILVAALVNANLEYAEKNIGIWEQ